MEEEIEIIETTSLSLTNNQITRKVICNDAFKWLNTFNDNEFPLSSSIFTSIPDISEIPSLFGAGTKVNVQLYENWFIDTISLILSKLRPESYAIFLQSDIRLLHPNTGEVIKWIDKSHLCSIAASKTKCILIWHKMALLNDYSMNHKSISRPQYSHFLCYYKTGSSDITKRGDEINNPTVNNTIDITNDITYPSHKFATPDVFYRGDMLWSKGIGINCALMGAAFLNEIAHSQVIIDPFCGRGTVLAAANALNISAIGVELSKKRCRLAQGVNICHKINSMPASLKRSLGYISPTISEILLNSKVNEDLNEIEINLNIDSNDESES